MATSESHLVLKPKLNNVSDDYEIKEKVIGIGMSGKIRLCVHRSTKEQYALKVEILFYEIR